MPCFHVEPVASVAELLASCDAIHVIGRTVPPSDRGTSDFALEFLKLYLH